GRTKEEALVGLRKRLLGPASGEAGEEQRGESRAYAESRLHCVPLCLSVVDTLRRRRRVALCTLPPRRQGENYLAFLPWTVRTYTWRSVPQVLPRPARGPMSACSIR